MNKITLKQGKLARFPLIASFLERLCCFHEINQIANNLPNTDNLKEKLESIFKQLDIEVRIRESDIAKIPSSNGPIIVVSNHPFGALDGLAIALLLLRVRPDVKIMANYLLNYITPLRDLFICFDPFAKGINFQNVTGAKEATSWLMEKKMLVVFPSGTVSHWQFKKGEVTDPSWNESIISLAKLTHASILPVYFSGKNSWYFQLAGMISPYLRTLLLPQQFFAKRHSKLSISIGSLIHPSELEQQGARADQLAFLRNRIYLLNYRAQHEISISSVWPPIAKPTAKSLLIKDFQNLPVTACYAEHKDLVCYIVTAQEIPHILTEIGRLREMSFREIGEGAGCPIDIDTFDPHYMHAFLWNKAESEVVGAYRFGLTDQILPKLGFQGLYLSTLYKESSIFLNRIHPGIELGRSFIISEYQKQPHSLLLIWKAIYNYLAQNPQYITFFGVVSISQLYQKLSRDVVVNFLYNHYFDANLASIIHAKEKYPLHKLPKVIKELVAGSEDFSQLSNIIREIEYDGKITPVFIKVYQGMGAKYCGFSIDSHFNNCIDCLSVCFIKDTPLNKLHHYMGEEGAENYLKYHNKKS